MREPNHHRHGNIALFACNFLSKGWEVSILGFFVYIQQKYNFPVWQVGILSGVFIVSQISTSLFAGRLAHAIHSRNVILLSVASSGISWVALLSSSHVALLYVAYVFGGVSSGLFEPIGNSLVAMLSHARNRSTAIGNFAACGDMGRIALVAISTALAGWFGLNRACVILLGSALLAFLLVNILISRAVDGSDAAEPETPATLRDLLANRRFCWATFTGIADSFSSASLYIFIPFLLTAKGVALASTLYFNVIFFAGYMSGRLALGRLADRWGAPNTVIISKLGMAILILMLTLVRGYALMVVILFLLGIFTRGSSPIIRAMVADSMDERISFHNAFSAYSFASRGSSAVSRPVFGFLLAYSGISSVFYLASIVSVITIYPAAAYKRCDRPAKPPVARNLAEG